MNTVSTSSLPLPLPRISLSFPPSQFQDLFLIILVIYLYIIISHMCISIYALISTYWVNLAFIVCTCVRGLSWNWTTCGNALQSSSSRGLTLWNFLHPHWHAGLVQATMLMADKNFWLQFPHNIYRTLSRTRNPGPLILIIFLSPFCDVLWAWGAKIAFACVWLGVGHPKIS